MLSCMIFCCTCSTVITLKVYPSTGNYFLDLIKENNVQLQLILLKINLVVITHSITYDDGQLKNEIYYVASCSMSNVFIIISFTKIMKYLHTSFYIIYAEQKAPKKSFKFGIYIFFLRQKYYA